VEWLYPEGGCRTRGDERAFALRIAPQGSRPTVVSARIGVLRTSERARNIHALVDVGDNSENSMARVSAVKTLEAVSDVEAARGGSATMTPGLVIQIVSGDAPPRVINPPTIDHDDSDANE
jgi:hypothetical protein